MIQAVIATWYNNIRSANGTVDSKRLITCCPRATTKALLLMISKTKGGKESSSGVFFVELVLQSPGHTRAAQQGHSGIIKEGIPPPRPAHDHVEDRSMLQKGRQNYTVLSPWACHCSAICGWPPLAWLQPGRMDAGHGRHLADDEVPPPPLPC